MVTFLVGRDAFELRAKARRLLQWRRAGPDGTDPDVFLAELRQRRGLVGTPEMIVEQIRSWATAGIQRIMLHVFDLDDIDGVELIAQRVLPEVAG